MEIQLISERKIKIGEKEYPIRIIELSGGIHIINILEKVYGKELEYLECKREKIRVKIGKRKDKYVPMVDPETVLFDGESAHRVRCANGVADDDMHDTFIVEECKY